MPEKANVRRSHFNVDSDALLSRVLLFTLTTAYVLILFGLVAAVVVLPFGAPQEILAPPDWLRPWLGHIDLLDAFLIIVAGPTLGINLMATVIVLLTVPHVYRWLRIGIHDLVYGQHDDAFALLANVHPHLEAMSAPQAILPTIAMTIAQTLKLPYVAIVAQGVETPVESTFGIIPPGAALTHLPLRYQTIEIGELRVAARHRDEALSQSDLNVLNDLARQVGITLYAAQLTTHLQQSRSRIVTAREEERRRLRRDLHDGLGPQLASQTLTLDVIAKLLHSNPEQAATLLLAVRQQMQQAVSDIRDLIYGLRPPVLDDLGLPGAIEEFVERIGQPGKLQIGLQLAEPHIALPAAVEVAAYRIVQEAVNNAVKHAQASLITVTLMIDEHAESPSSLRVVIRDNGMGLSTAHPAGIGLHSMRERAEELGGNCTIGQRREGGTEVVAHLPIE